MDNRPALRNHTFFSLAELNKAVAEKLIEFNNRKFKKMEGCRRNLFETIDKQPLPPSTDSVTPVLHYNIRGKNYYQHLSAPACSVSLSACVHLPTAPAGQEGAQAEKEADHA